MSPIATVYRGAHSAGMTVTEELPTGPPPEVPPEAPGGASAPPLRRSSTKRLVASILSGYHCFYFKQRGPHQILWRYDASKLDQGFKRNKRKYLRR